MNHVFRRCLLPVLLVVVVAITAAGPAWAGKATIIRDDFGVPHVFGNTLKATWRAVGYATAQDRLWQMELHRRTATGTLAEIQGPAALAGDVQARALFGPREFRRAEFLAASKGTKKILRAYAAGVNQWIAEASATGQLPPEFQATGLVPRPWTTDDSVAWGMALLFNFGVAGENEPNFLANLAELLAINGTSAGPAIFFDSHWVFDPTSPTTIPGAAAIAKVSSSSAGAPLPALPDFDVQRAARAWKRSWSGWERNLEKIGLRRGPASNAIAIGSKLSATGYPLLLGGPQQGYSVPQINHEIGIHGGGYNANGASVAGLPGVTIGVNRGLAWTLTTGGTDNNDVVLETLNPADPTQYLYQGTIRPLDCRSETFNVAGGSPVPQVLCRTVNGPVLQVLEGRFAFTLKSASRGFEMDSIETLLGVNRSRNIKKAEKYLAMAGHNFNFLAADTKGNIGYYHLGKIPIRAPGDSPFFPHIGDGQADWQGFIPFAALPQATNPAQGYFVNWNNKPTVAWFNSTGGFWQWGPVARVQTLINVMETVPAGAATVGLLEDANLIGGWTLDTPLGLGSSRPTVPVSTMLPVVLGLVDASADDRLTEVLGILGSWDRLKLDLAPRDGFYDSPAVAIFNNWWETFINSVFADELGGALDRNVAANMAARLLIPGLEPLNYPGYLGGETPSGAVTGALVAAMDALTAEYGSADTSTWLAEATMQSWSQIGAAPVPDTPHMNRGTYNQITRLKKGDIFAENVIAPGQSGNPLAPDGTLNPHFADQLGLYATWQYKDMYLNKSALKGHRESRTVIRTASNSKKKSKKDDK
ncbi:MAG: penicillin acylase family protein [bacterium]|nr:penicillin acylase family protein [bacterium]